MQTFQQLVSDFIETNRIDVEVADDNEVAALQFSVAEFDCSVFPSDDGLLVALQVQVGTLDDMPESTHADLLRYLHGLNAMARFTHCAVATVDADGDILVFQSLPLERMTGLALSDAMISLLGSAQSLQESVRLIGQGSEVAEDSLPPAAEPPFGFA